MGEPRQNVTIVNQRGLHARASAKFLGAVAALSPERVVLLPDGDEDLWSDDYADLISLA